MSTTAVVFIRVEIDPTVSTSEATLAFLKTSIRLRLSTSRSQLPIAQDTYPCGGAGILGFPGHFREELESKEKIEKKSIACDKITFEVSTLAQSQGRVVPHEQPKNFKADL